MYEIACMVDKGIGGHGNDDRCYVGNQVVSDGLLELDNEPFVIAGVCDGAGGESFGYEAAETAARLMAENSIPEVDLALICRLIENANDEILLRQKADSDHSKMATTIAGIVVRGDDMLAFNVGDSRVYRYREPFIAQLSKDHSLSEELKDIGLEPKPGQEHVITKYLGGASHNPYIFNGEGKAFEDDIYLICSDGISDVITNEEYEEVLKSEASLGEKCRTLVDLAVEKRSADNLSIIIARRK